MKKLTEYKPLTIEQRGQIMGIVATNEITETGCHHDMAYMAAKTYLIELEAVAQKYNWPVWTVFRTVYVKYNRADDLSKPAKH